MALPDLDAPESLTAADKYRRFRPRSLVEVKLISRPGLPPVWLRARVQTSNKGGAYCRTDKGKEAFYHWSEVRPCPDIDVHKPIGTLGEVMRGGLRALPPFLDASKPEPPSPPEPAPRGTVLISREDLESAKRDDMGAIRKKREKHVHQITPIASLFREQRLKRGWSQIQLANSLPDKLELTDNHISRIELGRLTPNDDTLIALAELFNLDLDKVIGARDGTPEPSAASTRHVPPVTVIRPVALPLPPPPAPVVWEGRLPGEVTGSAGVTPPDAAEKLAAFTDQLMGLAPPPLDREKRIEWFRLASRLYRLSEG